MTVKMLQVLIWGLQIRVGEFANKDFANNEAQLYYEVWGGSFSGTLALSLPSYA